MVISIDDYVGAEMGKKKGKFKSKRRKTHDVSEEGQGLYDKIIESFDPEWHRDTTLAHNDAYIEAAGMLKGKKPMDRKEAEEFLTDALIKYKSLAGLPVSKKKEHRHHVYNEVKQYLDGMDNSQGPLKGKVDHLIREGNMYRLLEAIHGNLLSNNIKGKIRYEVEQLVPHDKEHDFYGEIIKAHGNDIGVFFKKGKLAKLSDRGAVVENLSEHYQSEMARLMDDYTSHTKKGKKKKAKAH